MLATLRCTQWAENPLELPVDMDTIEEMHDQSQRVIRSGLLAALTMKQFMSGTDPGEILAKLYAELGGRIMAYTLDFHNGEEEEGLCDLSPSALGKHHIETLHRNPRIKEVLVQHGDCTRGPDCHIEAFYRALELPFPPPLD